MTNELQQITQDLNLFLESHKKDLEKIKPINEYAPSEIADIYFQWRLHCLNNIDTKEIQSLL